MEGQAVFTFSSVPVGKYRLTVSAVRFTTKAILTESASLAISVHQDLEGLVLQTETEVTQARVAASGRVFLDGAPAPAARIQKMLWSRDENFIASESLDVLSFPGGASVTGPDGQFGFGGGDGWIVLRHAGSPNFALKNVTAGGVDVTDGFDMKRVASPFEVHLTSQVSKISGVVKEADGGAAAACDVVVFAADQASWKLPFSRRVALVRANEKGEFQVTGLPAGQVLCRRAGRSRSRHVGRSQPSGTLARHRDSTRDRRRRKDDDCTQAELTGDNRDPSSARTIAARCANADARARANRTGIGTRHRRGHGRASAFGGCPLMGLKPDLSPRIATTDDEGKFCCVT
jgi:hypothetical protein